MYIYLLRRENEDDDFEEYDANHGHVIIAPLAEEARRIASEAHAYDPPEIWMSPKWVTCKLIGVANVGMEPGIVLTDFHAA